MAATSHRRHAVRMALTVQDLLELPVLSDARPEVLSGGDLATRPVRWVHTSEIYEIWPLLRGGEVLLTTGLGLVGASPEATAAYVRALARKDVAALLLELGRTFTRPPEALVSAALEHDLPLVVLHGVVPFIEVTETVHPLLLDHQVEELRILERASAEMNRRLVGGHGLPDLVDAVAELCGGLVGLYRMDGTLAAGSDVEGADDAWEVGVGTGPWARLVVTGVGSGQRRLMELCAGSLAVFLAHSDAATVTPSTAATALLRDLAAGRYVSGADITQRASALGLSAQPGKRLLALVVRTTTLTSGRTGTDAVVHAARRVLETCAAAEVDGQVLIAASLPFAELRERLSRLLDSIDAELGATVGGSVSLMTAGATVDDVTGLARSVPQAIEAATLATKLSLRSRLVLVSDLGVYDLLSGVVADAELERFVDEQLGPLLDQDARTGSELVRTLDAYLEAGLSKTTAAAALGIRRQTMYARLERISRLLGGLAPDDRQRRTALDLALVTWRMRSSAPAHRPR